MNTYKMKFNKFFTILFLSLFLITLVSSQGCADEGWKGYSKIHENKTITITCPTCDYINFSVNNVDGETFLNEASMNKSGNTFSYTFLGSDLNEVGTYWLDGYSNLDTPLGLCFDVTMSGKESSLGTYGILLLFATSLFFLLIWINIKFNADRRKQLYNKIVEGYFRNKNDDERNLGTVILYTLAYGLLKNLFMFYYLIVVFFMFIITELVESFGISSLTLLFTTMLNIFLWGFILVFIYMIFSFYELIMVLLKDITDSYRGLWNGR